jgi:rSAM/selenodomain-associated transferase 1
MTRKNSTAFILFTKNPVLGRVKTRLAKEVGNEEALRIYLLMLKHALRVVASFSFDDVKIYVDEWPQDRSYLGKYQNKLFLQRGDDLGHKMQNAIEEQLQEYSQVLLFGTDILELDETILTLARDQLMKCDAVLGPSKDGGYYLIGFKENFPTVFKDIPWSTSEVAKKTIGRLVSAQCSLFLTPELGDVDYKEDWDQYRHIVESRKSK